MNQELHSDGGYRSRKTVTSICRVYIYARDNSFEIQTIKKSGNETQNELVLGYDLRCRHMASSWFLRTEYPPDPNTD